MCHFQKVITFFTNIVMQQIYASINIIECYTNCKYQKIYRNSNDAPLNNVMTPLFQQKQIEILVILSYPIFALKQLSIPCEYHLQSNRMVSQRSALFIAIQQESIATLTKKYMSLQNMPGATFNQSCAIFKRL